MQKTNQLDCIAVKNPQFRNSVEMFQHYSFKNNTDRANIFL